MAEEDAEELGEDESDSEEGAEDELGSEYEFGEDPDQKAEDFFLERGKPDTSAN